MRELIWGAPTAALVAAAALYVSAKCRFVQVRRLGQALRAAVSGLRVGEGRDGTSPLEAVCTALAGTVGTGNIAGVAVALSMGGPGAVLWMWVSAFLGMGLKYAEIVLAVRYREKRGGEYVGGPMYTVKNGLGRAYMPLAWGFALFGTLASFGIGNMMQMGSILTLSGSGPIPAPVVGAGMAVLVLLTCRGGAKGRGRTAALVVPLMAAVYVAACLGVIGANLGRLPGAVLSIFRGALRPDAALGGSAGAAISWGFRRGLFSNEAGLGSSPMAHAGAAGESAEKQGLLGIFEVFADTLVLCTLTALTILCSGTEIPFGVPAGAELVSSALASVYGGSASNLFLSVSMALFAFSSMVSWSLYGETCAEFLAGTGFRAVYRAAFAAAVFLGALIPFSRILLFSDAATLLMLIPNLISLVILAGRERLT